MSLASRVSILSIQKIRRRLTISYGCLSCKLRKWGTIRVLRSGRRLSIGGRVSFEGMTACFWTGIRETCFIKINNCRQINHNKISKNQKKNKNHCIIRSGNINASSNLTFTIMMCNASFKVWQRWIGRGTFKRSRRVIWDSKQAFTMISRAWWSNWRISVFL